MNNRNEQAQRFNAEWQRRSGGGRNFNAETQRAQRKRREDEKEEEEEEDLWRWIVRAHLSQKARKVGHPQVHLSGVVTRGTQQGGLKPPLHGEEEC